MSVADWPRGVPEHYRYPAASLGRVLDEAADDFPDVVAVEAGGRRVSYRSLRDQVDRFAAALAMHGAGPGDAMGMAVGATMPAVVALHAAWRLGMTVAITDPDAPSDARATFLARRCRVVVVDDRWVGVEPSPRWLEVRTPPEDHLPVARATARRIGRVLRGRPNPRAPRLADLVRRTAPLPPDVTILSDRPALTIGTGHTWSHGNLVAAAIQRRLWIPDVVTGSERIAVALPFHARAAVVALGALAPLCGATVVLSDAGTGRAELAGTGATILVAGPDTFHALAGSSTAGAVSPALDLRVGLCHGFLPPAAVAAVERRTGAAVATMWGPDLALGGSHAQPVYGVRRADAVGLPLPDTEASTEAGVRLTISGPQVGAGPDGPAGRWTGTGHGLAVEEGWLRAGSLTDAGSIAP